MHRNPSCLMMMWIVISLTVNGLIMTFALSHMFVVSVIMLMMWISCSMILSDGLLILVILMSLIFDVSLRTLVVDSDLLAGMYPILSIMLIYSGFYSSMSIWSK